jgi:hypothetical protein
VMFAGFFEIYFREVVNESGSMHENG